MAVLASLVCSFLIGYSVGWNHHKKRIIKKMMEEYEQQHQEQMEDKYNQFKRDIYEPYDFIE